MNLHSYVRVNPEGEIIARCQAKDLAHAIEKMPILHGPAPIGSALMSFAEWAEEKRFIAECLKFPIPLDQL